MADPHSTKNVNTYVLRFVLCLIMVLVLFPASCSGSDPTPSDQSGSSGSAEQETIKIEIMTPSAVEKTIAPGRHFKASGTLTGEVPDDAVLKVALLDEQGQEVRYAQADQKGTGRVIPDAIGGEITVFAEGTDFSEVAYTAPELVAADPEHPDASVHDATIKCVYTDDTFYALIVGATDTAHGLAEADGYSLTDHEGKPYDALPEGTFRLQVTLSSAGGKELASASEEIKIGRTGGTIIHEITNEDAIRKGGMDLLKAWAAEENLTILVDLLPGFFGTHYQMSTLPMSVSCETAEYLPGKIRMLVYGNKSTSASYALEAAKYLQLEHTAENPDIVEYSTFSLGEPSFAGEKSGIVAFDEGENIRICRIDTVAEETKDGVFLTSEEQILGSDTDPSDGWTVPDGAFAIAGAMKPYQLRDDEVVPDEDLYGFYRVLNGAEALIYTFVPSDGTEPFSIARNTGVRRISAPDEEAGPALYEFYSVFPADTLKAGNSYDVIVQEYDRNHSAIPDAVCRFTIMKTR